MENGKTDLKKDPACYHHWLLSREPCPSRTVSCPEYVRLIFYSCRPGMVKFGTNFDSVGQCLSSLTKDSQQDPGQLFQSLDSWRNSLPELMHSSGSSEINICFLSIQALSYRFECILCRLIRRRGEGSQAPVWVDLAKSRLRIAIFELDTITKRVLSSGTLLCFPISLYVKHNLPFARIFLRLNE